eukprot:6206039-Pleurochrysis_carterae.AAC.2
MISDLEDEILHQGASKASCIISLGALIMMPLAHLIISSSRTKDMLAPVHRFIRSRRGTMYVSTNRVSVAFRLWFLSSHSLFEPCCVHAYEPRAHTHIDWAVASRSIP